MAIKLNKHFKEWHDNQSRKRNGSRKQLADYFNNVAAANAGN